MKKLLTTLLAIAMILAMCIPVMADTASGSNTGSILIENANKNRTYMAYKIFDASGSGTTVAYTTDATGAGIINDDEESPFSVDAQYNVTLKKDKSIEDIISWLKDNYQSFDSTGTTGIFDGDSAKTTISGLSYGYYYVTTGTDSVVSIDTFTGETKTINDKNPQGPNNPDKKITAEDGIDLGNSVTENAAKVGSKESFEITYNATNWVTVTDTTSNKTSTTKIENFYIKDTPTNLDIDVNSVQVYVNGSESALTSDDCTISYENNVLEIAIPWINSSGNHKYAPAGLDGNIPVKVTYDATITTSAASRAATNEVYIYYNHDANGTSDGTPVPTDPNDPPKTTTYTYKFQLNKVDENNNALAGAQFELYDDENTRVAFVGDGATYRLATADDETTTTTTTINMTTNTTVEITGLDNKNYTLKEIKAPEGYNTAANTTIYPSDSVENGNKLVKADGTYGANAGDAGNVTVVNRAGASLPTTGGIGTTIFYALGAILVIGAGVALIVRRRMNSER